MASYSIIIKNGYVIDGKNSPRVRADVGIKGNIIADIGDLSQETADVEIDARDRYVAPGFIDLTSHSDTHWTLFDAPGQESFLWQGVTTILGGNCGTSLAPLVSGNEIDALQKWFDVSSVNINWQSTAEFLDEIEKRPLGVNFATLTGFGTLRRGSVKNIDQGASTGEIDKMRFLLEEALSAGSFGLSTSLGRVHEQSAGTEELVSLAEVVKKSDGILKYHLRDEGSDILPSLSEVFSITRASDVRTHISHFKLIGKGAWKMFNDAMIMIEQGLQNNMHITLDIYPYTKTGSSLYLLLPSWAREGGREEILGNLEDPEKRALISSALKELTLHYDQMIIASSFRDQSVVGKTIEELSVSTNLSSEDVIINLLNVNELTVTIFNEALHEAHIDMFAKKYYSVFATDGVGYNVAFSKPNDLPHPRSFGTFPKVLNYFVKEKEALTWEEAIYKMTKLPADILGLERRGVIKKNTFADIVVFDPEKIRDKSTYTNPLQYSEGMEWVLVNGGIAISEGAISNELHGKILRKEKNNREWPVSTI
ncbi:MAG: hypothetical protein COU46_01540 [Candidatus Niyogibacteria bacterium CG10_big_fil_rev_8_21_14_0_10_42_19]|uniref:Amidohydrolase-related domain-containing protein n=1 Tax=Candidatus Niyogibacteria bacterium CG10_big_fil_rev_8_21_14_0_10_42_19 TaxID=1974725 RepID=A0A2H0TFS1_9BACT|nr:MAG: hypothetical protein COU46_01540 [Candidatus Niyogibacteria bacterium CG10_big_fil_rev_8_21_14_0_10_42_19]